MGHHCVTSLPGSVGDYLVAKMGASPRAPARPGCSADTGWKPAKTLLVLDNVTGGHAEPLYPRLWAGSAAASFLTTRSGRRVGCAAPLLLQAR